MSAVLGVPGALVTAVVADQWSTKAGGFPAVSAHTSSAAVTTAAVCSVCAGALTLVLQVRIPTSGRTQH